LSQIRADSKEVTKTMTGYVTATIPARDRSAQIAQQPQRKRFLLIAALVLAIGAAGFWGMRRMWPGAALPEEKRIAVLPFVVIGNDEGVRALADGLVETITSKLTQIEEFQGKLMVVPASEIRSRHITSSEAARRVYGANLAFTGSAQRWGDRIQFTQNLVDTVTVRQIASKTFEFDAAKPIALRDGAVNSAVRLLALKLTPASSQSLAAGETANPAAYAEYLRGIGYLARYDLTGNVDRAIASLSEATDLDPKYALAFAGLGQAHWRKAKTTSDAKEAQLALENIQTAIRLDPRAVEARVKLGEIYSESGRPQEAIQVEKSALQVAPENTEAYRALGQAYASALQYEQAEAAYREAIRKQPADWYGYLLLGLFYWDRGRNGDARTEWEAARKLTPDNEVIYRDLAGLDMREGNFRHASDTLTQTTRFEPGSRTYVTLGIAYYYQRRYEEAAAAFKSGIDLNPGLYQNWGNLATVYRHLTGDEQKARDAFHKAIELADKSLQVVKTDYATHANLAEYWAKLGDQRKALAEIDGIPEAARGPLMDRIILAYELTGNRRLAIAAVKSLPSANSPLPYLKNDPDLEALWRDPAFGQGH
jgi:tetratricopeptide (TPR) repeat protein